MRNRGEGGLEKIGDIWYFSYINLTICLDKEIAQYGTDSNPKTCDVLAQFRDGGRPETGILADYFSIARPETALNCSLH